jgi:site-specific DNA-methyltransferase (adenine-specific)
MTYKIHQGSNLDILPTLPDNSVDSIVTDPPYELGFMGKFWDSTGIAYNVQMWKECLRVLKPGGHLLAFSGSRTYHRMAVAIEDAGFQIRDQIMWVYGSGFPKSHNVSKALDKMAGVQFSSKPASGVGFMNAERSNGYNTTLNQLTRIGVSTPEAKQWEGWGTALKPAHEPIVLARKSIEGTVAENVLKWGVGGLNIDGCRVDFVSDDDRKESTTKNQHEDFGTPPMTNNQVYGDYSMMKPKNYQPTGRFPANLMHDGSQEVLGLFANDAGRFFYCPKANKKDRDEGCEELETKEKPAHMRTAGGTGETSMTDGFQATQRKNTHPTVKPTELMQYLCRLITPPNGTVLDPFNGSGSTGKGAILEGFNYIGIELDPEYIKISEARINAALTLKK